MPGARTTFRLAAIIGGIAALLAWTAVGVRYLRHGSADWIIGVAGLLMGAFAYGAWSRSRE